MIAKLSGRLDWIGDTSLVLDVGGVGYLVHCSARTMRGLPAAGSPAILAIETVVREDSITLYGFLEASEREWFRLLQTVQGVGAKVALAIFSALSTGELARAIAAQDKATIARAQGVGPKLAQRIATELKDRVGSIAVPAGQAPLAAVAARGEEGPAGEAISALVHLGYKRFEAADAIAKVQGAQGEDAKTADLIRGALKELGR